ncbi:phosphotransferase [Kineococcus sp. SYSU DK006]|uniref:phosphotransferase n=1 Tax=Kineococcus sp. SYSU DK006 TaxID=3383127 RepID=UPI003D7E5DCD
MGATSTPGGIPRGPVPVPGPLLRVLARELDGAPGRPGAVGAPEAVWVNQAGGSTFRVPVPGGAVFAKWAPAGAPLDLAAEEERLRWARSWTPVPQVLAAGRHASGSWLLTRGLPGENAVLAHWRARPHVAVPALGRGLRRLHEALPVRGCPFSWSVQQRLAAAVGDVSGLRRPPPVDRLVVCHGDACSPNTLLDPATGEACGHVDLSALGVADRWADLAVATMSVGWNYGPGWEDAFLDAYGVAPDPARTAYYRDLWNAGP